MIGFHKIPIIMWTKEKKKDFWDWLTVDVLGRFAFATYTEAVVLLLLLASFECTSKVLFLSNSTRAIIVLWANRFTLLQTHFQCIHFSTFYDCFTFSNASTLMSALSIGQKIRPIAFSTATATTKNIKGPKCEYIFLSLHANIISNNLTCKSMINGTKKMHGNAFTHRAREKEMRNGWEIQRAACT